MKSGLEEKLLNAGDELKSLEKLRQLAALHVNTLRMTSFMPCRVSRDPQTDLDSLFDELVEPSRNAKPLSKADALKQTLDEKFWRRKSRVESVEMFASGFPLSIAARRFRTPSQTVASI